MVDNGRTIAECQPRCMQWQYLGVKKTWRTHINITRMPDGMMRLRSHTEPHGQPIVRDFTDAESLMTYLFAFTHSTMVGDITLTSELYDAKAAPEMPTCGICGYTPTPDPDDTQHVTDYQDVMSRHTRLNHE